MPITIYESHFFFQSEVSPSMKDQLEVISHYSPTHVNQVQTISYYSSLTTDEFANSLNPVSD